MRTCLNCKYRHKRSNVAPCQKCIDTQSYINWKSELPRLIALWTSMALICGVGVYGVKLFFAMAQCEEWWAGLKSGLAGVALAGGALIALSYLTEREERRNRDDL